MFRGLALAAQVGLADLLPHRVAIEAEPGPGDADIQGYLSGVLGQQAVVSVRIGPPRANRKPVLELLTADGGLIGFAKIGVNELTRDLVRAEARALTVLAAAPLVRLGTPPLIHHGQWRGHEVLVQEALSGSAPPSHWDGLSQAMVELAGVQGVTRLPLGRSPYWRELRQRLKGGAQRDVAGQLLTVMSCLEPIAATTIVGFGSWHGDWTPWNMTVSGGGRVLVWDWERFQAGVPIGYDAVHYRLQALVDGGCAPRAAAEDIVAAAATVLAPFGIQDRTAQVVTCSYLLDIAARYLTDGQAEAGGRLGDVGNWLAPVLTGHASELTPGGNPGG